MLASLRVFFGSLFSRFNRWTDKGKVLPAGALYQLEARTISGETIRFDRYRGKKLLIVNTASRCGFTSQYEDLQKLHEMYHDRLVILGFPSNDFLWQEPGTNEDIAEFCKLNFGVTFQMFEKISVKGSKMHPVYKWLSAKSGHWPSWNFCKYLIDENEEVKGFFEPSVKPLDSRITNLI